MFGKKKQTQSQNQQVIYNTPGGRVYEPYLHLADKNHLLVAGCTGSGKSVVVNGIITSLIMTESPAHVQFILLDPKRVELTDYAHIPHTVRYANTLPDMIAALRFAVAEMERRFQIMQRNGWKECQGSRLYVIIDELADLMTTGKKDCFPLLQRLAQLGRAARVFLIGCTQTVHYTVIPSTLKCNFPVVLGLKTANPNQSRYLVDTSGCELLPDPAVYHTSFGFLRSGANLQKIEFYRYTDAEQSSVINHWNSPYCVRIAG